MPNKEVAVVRNCKTPKGWKRYPVVYDKKGKIRPGFVMVSGEAQRFLVGRYHVRWYEGRKTVYKDVGDDPRRALLELRRQSERLLSASEAQREELIVSFPRSVLKRAKDIARDDGATLEAWLLTVIAQKIGSIDATS
jgi:hypothetical protein